METNGASTVAIDHLALYGTEGTANEGDGSFRNPVYSNDMHGILVWNATVSENSGLYDKQGKQICSGILSPGFDTSYIQCRSFPVIPRDTEAVYFQKGAFAENDHLEVTLSSGQQQAADLKGQSVLVDGTAQKINLLFSHPRTSVSKDLAPQGT